MIENGDVPGTELNKKPKTRINRINLLINGIGLLAIIPSNPSGKCFRTSINTDLKISTKF